MSVVGESPGLLERLALHRPELRAWALYDWANSAMVTVIVTAVYPIYFSNIAASGMEKNDATTVHGAATTVGLLLAAVLAPVLGAVADRAGAKKRLLGAFLLLGAGSVAAMTAVGDGDWVLGAVLFVLANVGAASSFVFYDSLLPHIARGPTEADRASTAGYALGYLGGGLLLVLCLALVRSPASFGLPADDPSVAPRVGFALVAVWWLVFSVPLFRSVPEPPALGITRLDLGAALRGSLAELRVTLRELWRLRQAFWMLVAFLVYNDGIVTFIRMATVYGGELGLPQEDMIGAIALVQFVGIPATLGFGWLAGRFGAKRTVLAGVAVYAFAGILGFHMSTREEFWALAALIGLVQGGTQALSRSLYASLIPRQRSGEFFGLFAVLSKFAGVAGPALFSLCAAIFDESRYAVLPLVAMFVVGGLLLARVDVETGRRAARAAEADAGVPRE